MANLYRENRYEGNGFSRAQEILSYWLQADGHGQQPLWLKNFFIANGNS
jgi:hypothetical protein